jgi:galactokinase
VRLLRAKKPAIRSLRDVSVRDLALLGDDLPLTIKRRCAHVIGENQRVMDMVEALRQGDMQRAGTLMNISHESLRENYEVSTPELDVLVAAARAVPGCYGSRLTGAGFGGCTVSLVKADVVDAFRERVQDEYRRHTGRAPAIYVCQAVEGAGLVVGDEV